MGGGPEAPTSKTAQQGATSRNEWSAGGVVRHPGHGSRRVCGLLLVCPQMAVHVVVRFCVLCCCHSPHHQGSSVAAAAARGGHQRQHAHGALASTAKQQQPQYACFAACREEPSPPPPPHTHIHTLFPPALLASPPLLTRRTAATRGRGPWAGPCRPAACNSHNRWRRRRRRL
jgi:hypothetical protein